MPKSQQQRTQGFRWQPNINGTMPRAMLVEWLASNYDAYFRATNLAEVVEGFRQQLLAAGFRGCTIDEIQMEITALVRNDPILQWLEPGHNDKSRMDILVDWLGVNYTAYARARLAKEKDALLAPLAAQIVGIGFSDCTPRDLRHHIKHLKEQMSSPYLGKFASVLSVIFAPGRRGRPAKATRKKLSTRKVPTRSKRPASRASQTNYAVQAAPDLEHESASTVEPPIKAELGFPDGSVHAPVIAYSDDDDDRLKGGASPAKTLTLDEIHQREALFDARLKFGRKKTLSQEEIDLYFPKPRK